VLRGGSWNNNNTNNFRAANRNNNNPTNDNNNVGFRCAKTTETSASPAGPEPRRRLARRRGRDRPWSTPAARGLR
jgi:hypothetical protein